MYLMVLTSSLQLCFVHLTALGASGGERAAVRADRRATVRGRGVQLCRHLQVTTALPGKLCLLPSRVWESDCPPARLLGERGKKT